MNIGDGRRVDAMDEEITFTANDTYRAIGRIIQNLKAFESPICNPRVKAILITQLEESQLRSLTLINEE